MLYVLPLPPLPALGGWYEAAAAAEPKPEALLVA